MSLILSGSHMTWFEGADHGYSWGDPDGYVWVDAGARRGNEGRYASGLPYNTLGVALWTGTTLRGWFEVKVPGHGIKFIARHVDIGPHGVIDLTAPMAYFLFRKPGLVPDSPTPWIATFLGRKLPADVCNELTYLATGKTVPIPETL